MRNIYGAPPHPPEQYHEAIQDIQTIVRGMQAHSYNLEGLSQANAVLTIQNSVVMSQLALMTVTMNAMQVQLKTLASAQTNQERPKRKHYCQSCGSNYTHGRKTYLSKKAVHQDDAYYKKRMRGSEKGCELQLGAIVNKIEIGKPKISLIKLY